MMKNLLTVIMPVYNGMPCVKEAVESILAQTYTNFDFVIVDDGSIDESPAYLTMLKDPRITVRYQNNKGLCDTLNETILGCDTEMIARLDQDDIAMPLRLEKQVDFLSSHKEYGCILGNISRITANGRDFGSYNKITSKKVSDYNSKELGCVVHSTICFKKEAFMAVGGYRSFLYPADDYDLLLRFEEKFKIAVINDVIVKYRIHSAAGTFNTFSDMRIKTLYVEAMASRRRSGQSEISLSEFCNILHGEPLWKKWRRNIKNIGKLMFRKAGLSIGERWYISGFFILGCACLFAPNYAFNRLLSLYRARNMTLNGKRD